MQTPGTCLPLEDKYASPRCLLAFAILRFQSFAHLFRFLDLSVITGNSSIPSKFSAPETLLEEIESGSYSEWSNEKGSSSDSKYSEHSRGFEVLGPCSGKTLVLSISLMAFRPERVTFVNKGTKIRKIQANLNFLQIVDYSLHLHSIQSSPYYFGRLKLNKWNKLKTLFKEHNLKKPICDSFLSNWVENLLIQYFNHNCPLPCKFNHNLSSRRHFFHFFHRKTRVHNRTMYVLNFAAQLDNLFRARWG